MDFNKLVEVFPVDSRFRTVTSPNLKKLDTCLTMLPNTYQLQGSSFD